MQEAVIAGLELGYTARRIWQDLKSDHDFKGDYQSVQRFVRGLRNTSPLPFRRIVEVLRQVLAALGEAHELGIIHRDLKPENVILEPTRAGGDFVKVVDFGLAKMKVEKQQPSITSPGIVCGTPEYMSPEQGRGDPLDARSDLYSVGVVLFLLLTGRLPFEADSPTQVVLSHLTQPPPDPRAIAPERKIPDSLVAVLMKSMEKEAKRRYRDADDFSGALAGALAEIEDRGQARSGAALAGVRCLGCGAINSPSQKFCGECGLTTTSTQLTTLPPLEDDRASMAPLLAANAATAASKRADTLPAPNRDRSDAVTDAPPGRAERSRTKLPLALMARDGDLAWLAERRAKASAALAGARIVGEPGIGKTRLLREFLAKAAAVGGVVVETEPDPAWAEVGYYALRRAIVLLAGLPESGGEAREWTAASAEAKRGLAVAAVLEAGRVSV